MAEASHDWSKHKKSYMIVGAILFACTFLTVGLAKIHFFDHGPPGPTTGDYIMGLSLAGIKASLVALIFMHLNHEKNLIYKILLFTFLFFVSLMALTIFADVDPIKEQYDTLQTTNGKLTDS